MSLRVETDENGEKWIICDVCDVTEDLNEYVSEAEMEAGGWTEENDMNLCPDCSKYAKEKESDLRELIRQIIREEYEIMYGVKEDGIEDNGRTEREHC
jgi:hypothetical protein